MRPAIPAVLLTMLLLAGCARTTAAEPGPTASTTVASSTPVAPTPPPTRTHRPRPSPSPKAIATLTATPSESDPRWRFFSADQRLHGSPWYAGQHRIMIGFGCTPAPYYDHDPRCPGREGFHHGIDVAMACGTVLRSAVDGVVLPPSAPGTPGPAYGVNPFRIRTGSFDILLGHTRTVFVKPGDHVRRGQQIALSSDSGAPDGCHLHFEVRRAGHGLDGALDPAPLLHLT